MKPTIGRIVHFRLTAEQAAAITGHRNERLIRGNPINEGTIVPMVVTAVWPTEYPAGAHLMIHAADVKYESEFGVNGHALLDGDDSLWVTSAPQHSTLPGCWFWPPRES